MHIIEGNPPHLPRTIWGHSAHFQLKKQNSVNPDLPLILRLEPKADWTEKAVFPGGGSEQTLSWGWRGAGNTAEATVSVLAKYFGIGDHERFKRGK